MKDGLKIAISGKSGCGNTTVCRLLAETLNLSMINYTFRNLAIEKGVDFDQLCRLAETNPQYDYYLDDRQIEMTRKGNCILGSRLAVWLLHDADLRVYLDAPLEVRAERIHNREGGASRQKLAETKARDKRDVERYKRLYNIDVEDYAFVDLPINTALYTPKEIIRLIIDKLPD